MNLGSAKGYSCTAEGLPGGCSLMGYQQCWNLPHACPPDVKLMEYTLGRGLQPNGVPFVAAAGPEVFGLVSACRISDRNIRLGTARRR